MGGDAFRSGPEALYTPRMATFVYLHVKKNYHDILLRYFTSVTTPIEAPEKEDYGDIDYVVSTPKAGYKGPEQLMKDLGAVQRRSGGPTTNFAVPWPENFPYAQNEIFHNHTPMETSSRFIQIDVTVNQKGEEYYDWEIFHKSHGDMWCILGSTIRKYGLTVNDEGLHLRIKEIEHIDRKKSLVFLTNDPCTVLQFLDLDEKKYWHQFNSVNDMFEYAASCRFFWVKEDEEDVSEEKALEERDTDKKELKHNDRQRMRKRPIFRRWIAEFIPDCRRQGRLQRAVQSREGTTQDIFVRFPNVKPLYDERVEKFRKEKQVVELWRNVIKRGVPELEDNRELRGAAIRGLKAIILTDDYSLGIIAPPKLGNGFYDVEKIVEFVKEDWERVGEIGLRRQRERAVESMAATRLKKSQTAVETSIDE